MRDTTMVRALALSLGLLLGCDEDPKRGLEAFASTRPLPVESGLFYTMNDPSAEQVTLPDSRMAGRTAESGDAITLDLSGDKPRIDAVELPPGYARALPRPGHPGEVVVLASGHDQYRDGKKIVSAENGHVLLFSRAGQLLDVELGGNFNFLELSDDGRFAVAFSPSGNQSALNAIEVVDLEASSAQQAPVTRLVTLGLDGRAPRRLIFAPSTGFSRRLLVVSFTDALQLLDLEHPERGAISVALKTVNDARTLEAEKILFRREGSGGAVSERIYVRSSNSTQIMVLDLIAAPEERQQFRPAPSFVNLTGLVRDFDVVGTGDALRLVALGDTLEVVNPKIGESVRIEGGSGFGALHAFEGTSPVDTRSTARALLYQNGQPRIGFAEIGDQSTWGAANVELVELGEPLSQIIPLQKRKLVLGLHGGTRISIIDLEQRKVVPISLESAAADLLLDETDQHARLWTANSSGIVSVLDLVTLQRTPIPVALTFGAGGREDDRDAATRGALTAPGSIVLIPGPSRRIALVQPSASGRITLLNADFNAADVDATLAPRELVGFFYAGLLD